MFSLSQSEVIEVYMGNPGYDGVLEMSDRKRAFCQGYKGLSNVS